MTAERSSSLGSGTTASSPVRAAIDAYLDACRRGDVAARVACFAEDGLFEDPVGSGAHRGRAAIADFLRQAPATMVLRPVLHRVIECGPEALAHFSMEISGWQPEAVVIEVFETVKVDAAGAITEMRAYFNEASISPAGAGGPQ